MNIFFEGFQMKLIKMKKNDEMPEFYFEHGGIYLHLRHRDSVGWRISIGNTIKESLLRESAFYQFLCQDFDKQQEIGEKMIRYLLFESPLRLSLMAEYSYKLLEEGKTTSTAAGKRNRHENQTKGGVSLETTSSKKTVQKTNPIGN